MMSAYLTATRYALIEQVRNRIAFGLLLIFLPLWDFVISGMVPKGPVSFKLLGSGALLTIDGHQLVLLTAGFNALTLIIGFMVFSATMKNTAFDRRLVLSGYAQPVLMLAKLTLLVILALVISLYASLILLVFWRPDSLLLVWVGYGADALIYGALGLLLGVLATNEVVGFFVIIMVSLWIPSFRRRSTIRLPTRSSSGSFPAMDPSNLPSTAASPGPSLDENCLLPWPGSLP